MRPEQKIIELEAYAGTDDLIRVQDRFYILATSDRIDDRSQVLKCGETFAVFDRCGDIRVVGRGEQGLYAGGTRFLSRFELSLQGQRLLLLGSSLRQDAAALSVDLTNPDLRRGEQLALERGRLDLRRHKTLGEGSFEERIEISNYGMAPAEVSIAVRLEADWSDIFEVRGFTRARSGQRAVAAACCTSPATAPSSTCATAASSCCSSRTQMLDGQHPDASNLLLPTIGSVDARDPRFVVEGGWMLRYRSPDEITSGPRRWR